MNQSLDNFEERTTPGISLALADNPRLVDQIVNTELCGARYYTSSQDSSSATYLGSSRIGSLNILHFESHGLPRCDRRPDHIRSDNLDQFVLCLPISARILIQHRGLDSEIVPGEFLLVSTRKPMQGAMFALAADTSCSARFVRIPGPLLRERIANADDYSNHAMPIRRGVGALMRGLLEEALAESTFFSAQDGYRVASLLVDSISHTLLSNPQARLVPARISPADQILARARSFVDANLSDPALDAARVAQYCQVSVRHLHNAFKPGGETLGGYIRERRLLQCRNALRDDTLRHRTIIEIAGQWGFEDPSHFSRCYKQRFGKTPRQERFQALTQIQRS
ncbi:MAG: AraC family transcriptional regulator [Porticoccaceae bacterium]